MATCFSILPGKFHGQRSLTGYSPWCGKQSDTTDRTSTCLKQDLVCLFHVQWCVLIPSPLSSFPFGNHKFVFFSYLFIAVLGLPCCVRAFSNCGKGRLLFIAAHGLPIVMSSVVVEPRLWALQCPRLWAPMSPVAHGLSNCGSRVQLRLGMWDSPGPGIGSVSPASAGRLFNTGSPEKSHKFFLCL